MAELKPCPFCGGESRLLHNAKRKIYGKDEYRMGVVACCNVCEARMFYGSENLATEAWNRRATIEPERKTGKWVLHENQRQEDVDNGNYLYVCSECGKSDLHAKTQEVPFCWWCGSEMREGEQE